MPLRIDTNYFTKLDINYNSVKIARAYEAIKKYKAQKTTRF